MTLWRRTHPLATVAVTFGSAIALTAAGWLLGQPEPVGLYTFAVVPVLVYALTRWGSGRDVVLGLAIAAGGVRACRWSSTTSPSATRSAASCS